MHMNSSSRSIWCFPIVCLLLATCGTNRHHLQELVEDGTPLFRTSGGPLHESPPFHLEKEVVFGDPLLGEEATLSKPRGYMEVPGGLAVFDDGDLSLKVYNDDGSFRFKMGRQGEGPGEFNGPWMNHSLTPDGMILITDGWNNRLTRVNPDTGTFETIPMKNANTWDAAQVGPDLFALIHVEFTPEMEQLESLDLVDTDFSVVDTITAVPRGRVLSVRGGPDSERAFIPVSKPFWPIFSWWAQGDKIAVCKGRSFRVELYDYSGTRLRIFEWDAPILSVTDSMWQAAQRQIKRDFTDDWATVWSALERPEQIPAIEAVRQDDNGRVWALRHIPSERWGGPEDQTLYWDVLSPEGEWLGTQPIAGVSRYFGRDTTYVIEDLEESSVVVRYRLIPAGSR